MVVEVILWGIEKRVEPVRRDEVLHVGFKRNILVMIAKQEVLS
jgi:hypothetical protein